MLGAINHLECRVQMTQAGKKNKQVPRDITEVWMWGEYIALADTYSSVVLFS